MAGVEAVRQSLILGSLIGTPKRAGLSRGGTPAQKGHNPGSDRLIAPRFLQELPEFDSLPIAMELRRCQIGRASCRERV